ncbi:hypothetical protein GGR57DRAFT_342782 [Xylariaceae sp. FL1272]|nr:hypothetical protein GGR57DRAFT_342782 [Xylariaceae sp. FL1272]
MAPKETILITGLNGYIAGRTSETALKSGYRIRGTVRDPAVGEQVKAVLCGLGYSGDDIEVIHVPDLCEPNTLDPVASGCIAIVHLASPITNIWSMRPTEVLRVAVSGTQNVLSAAQKAGPQLRSVVLASSTAALFNFPLESRIYDERDWNTASEQILSQKEDEADMFNAYLASKTAAEKLFWAFQKEHKPSFSMTSVLPSYVIGAPLIPWKDANAIPYSNSPYLEAVSNKSPPDDLAVYRDTIDIRDVARMLLWPIQNTKKADGERFICSSAAADGQKIADILSKHLPSLGMQGGNTSRDWSVDYLSNTFDSSKALRATGQNWIPYEKSTVDMALFIQRYLNKRHFDDQGSNSGSFVGQICL